MKKEKREFEIPVEGSLGLLALGHTGLIAWREKRRAAGVQKNLPSEEEEKPES